MRVVVVATTGSGDVDLVLGDAQAYRDPSF